MDNSKKVEEPRLLEAAKPTVRESTPNLELLRNIPAAWKGCEEYPGFVQTSHCLDENKGTDVLDLKREMRFVHWPGEAKQGQNWNSWWKTPLLQGQTWCRGTMIAFNPHKVDVWRTVNLQSGDKADKFGVRGPYDYLDSLTLRESNIPCVLEALGFARPSYHVQFHLYARDHCNETWFQPTWRDVYKTLGKRADQSICKERKAEIRHVVEHLRKMVKHWTKLMDLDYKRDVLLLLKEDEDYDGEYTLIVVYDKQALKAQLEFANELCNQNKIEQVWV